LSHTVTPAQVRRRRWTGGGGEWNDVRALLAIGVVCAFTWALTGEGLVLAATLATDLGLLVVALHQGDRPPPQRPGEVVDDIQSATIASMNRIAKIGKGTAFILLTAL
jgi:hypothetical protein